MHSPTFPTRAGDLGSLADFIKSDGAYDVDAREWHEEWTDSWVAFIDVIGFGDVSERSRETAVNVTVRFHRALTAAQAKYPTARFLRFTDAAYVVAESITDLLKLTSDVQHYCLALNAIRLGLPSPAWVHLVVPRITIAWGSVLTPPDPLPDESKYLGIDRTSLVIGDAIVFAYRAERGSAGGLTSVRIDDAPAARLVDIRGNVAWPRSVLERWSEGNELLNHDGVVDFPWLLLRPSQPSGPEIWSADKNTMQMKLQVFRDQWRCMFRDYVYNAPAAVVGKHYTAVMRHLISIFDMRDGQRPSALRTPDWLDAQIDTM